MNEIPLDDFFGAVRLHRVGSNRCYLIRTFLQRIHHCIEHDGPVIVEFVWNVLQEG